MEIESLRLDFQPKNKILMTPTQNAETAEKKAERKKKKMKEKKKKKK